MRKDCLLMYLSDRVQYIIQKTALWRSILINQEAQAYNFLCAVYYYQFPAAKESCLSMYLHIVMLCTAMQGRVMQSIVM